MSPTRPSSLRWSSPDAFLVDFHGRHPGCTSRAFADGLTQDGLSSYDHLLQGAMAVMGPSGSLLDLACGDGYLLERARTVFPGATLGGIDMSDAELALALVRLAGMDCHLWLGRADALPVPDGSQDVVTCHMALMLMTDLDAVLAEVRRVLRPRGRLLAILSGERQRQTGAYDRFLTALAAVPGFAERALTLGDRRLRTESTCRDRMTAAGFTLFHYEPLPVRFRLAPGAEWAFFAEMYTDDWLSPEDTAALQRRFADETRDLRQPDGSVILEVVLTAVTCGMAL